MLLLLLLVRSAQAKKEIFLWHVASKWSPVFCVRTSSHCSCENKKPDSILSSPVREITAGRSRFTVK